MEIQDVTLDWTAIIEDGNKPRSIREIKEKYQLSFPFSVRRVLHPGTYSIFPVGSVINVTGFVKNKIGEWQVDCEPEQEAGQKFRPSIDFPHYVLWD